MSASPRSSCTPRRGSSPPASTPSAAAHSLGWDPAGLPDPATSTAAGQLAWLAERLHTSDSDSAGVAARLRQRFGVFQAHTRMLAGFRPAGPAFKAPTLIASADHSPNAPTRAYWPRVLGGYVSTLRLDSDHYTFLRPPLVAEVGTAILKFHSDCE